MIGLQTRRLELWNTCGSKTWVIAGTVTRGTTAAALAPALRSACGRLRRRQLDEQIQFLSLNFSPEPVQGRLWMNENDQRLLVEVL